MPDGASDAYEIKASNLMVPLASKDATQSNGLRDGTYSDQNTSGLATHGTKVAYDKDTYEHFYYDKGVKFIYVTFADGEVDSVEFKSGIQNVSNDELREQIMGWPSQAAVKDEQVKAVVIKRESADASLKNMLYVTKVTGYKEVDKDTNESFFQVEVVRFGDDDKLVEDTIMVNKDLQIGQFASYTKVAGTKYEDNYYRVKVFERHNANPAAIKVLANSGTTPTVSEVKESSARGQVIKSLINLNATSVTTFTGTKLVAEDSGSGATTASTDAKSYIMGTYRGSSTTVPGSVTDVSGIIRTDKAEWLNLTNITKYDDIDNAEDLFDIAGNGSAANVALDILLNEKPDSDGFRTAYLIVIKAVASGTADGGAVNNGSVQFDAGLTAAEKTAYGTIKNDSVTTRSTGRTEAHFDIEVPNWVYTAGGATTATITYDIWLDGEEYITGQSTSSLAVPATGDLSVNFTVAPGNLPMSEVKDHSVSLVVTDVDWSLAKVEVYDTDGQLLPVNAGNTSASLTTASTGAQLKFQVNESSAATGVAYSISGAYGVSGAATTGLSTAGTAINAANTTTGNYYAKGGEIVKIILDMSVTATYNVKVQGGAYNSLAGPTAMNALPNSIKVDIPATSTDRTAEIAVTTAAATVSTKSVRFTIAVTKHTDVAVTGFEVGYTLKNGTETTTGTVLVNDLGGAASKDIDLYGVKGDVELTINSIKAVMMEFVVKGATAVIDATGTTLTVEYMEPVADIRILSSALTSYIGGTYSSGTLGNAVAKDGKLVITWTGTSPTSGQTVTVDNIAMNDAGDNSLSCTITMPIISGNGTYTCTVANGK